VSDPDIERIVREFVDAHHKRSEGGISTIDLLNLANRAAELAVAEEREKNADLLHSHARRLVCGKRRTNQVDRHVADVLTRLSQTIRAGKEVGSE
jgi:hypothetical protein